MRSTGVSPRTSSVRRVHAAGASRGGTTVYRLFVSWRALAAAFVLAVAGLSLLAYNLDRQQREEALRNVVAQAHVVNELLLHVEYRAGTGDLDPGDLARVDS